MNKKITVGLLTKPLYNHLLEEVEDEDYTNYIKELLKGLYSFANYSEKEYDMRIVTNIKVSYDTVKEFRDKVNEIIIKSDILIDMDVLNTMKLGSMTEMLSSIDKNKDMIIYSTEDKTKWRSNHVIESNNELTSIDTDTYKEIINDMDCKKIIPHYSNTKSFIAIMETIEDMIEDYKRSDNNG
jgi:hypothetical protein